MAKLSEIEEFAKKVSDLALDEFEYEGKTIREWTELILNGNLTEVVGVRIANTAEQTIVFST